MVLRIFHKAGNEPKFHGLNDNCNLPLKLLTKALHFIDEEELESDNAKIKKDKIHLQRAACFFIESDYQAANNDANQSLKLKLSTKVGIYRKVFGHWSP